MFPVSGVSIRLLVVEETGCKMNVNETSDNAVASVKRKISLI